MKVEKRAGGRAPVTVRELKSRVKKSVQVKGHVET